MRTLVVRLFTHVCVLYVCSLYAYTHMCINSVYSLHYVLYVHYKQLRRKTSVRPSRGGGSEEGGSEGGAKGEGEKRNAIDFSLLLNTKTHFFSSTGSQGLPFCYHFIFMSLLRPFFCPLTATGNIGQTYGQVTPAGG